MQPITTINNGKSFVDTVEDPTVAQQLLRAINGPVYRRLWGKCGPVCMVILTGRMMKELRRLRKLDWSGLDTGDQAMRDMIFQTLVPVKILMEVVGRKQALSIMKDALMETSDISFGRFFPSVEELEAYADPFGAFKAHFRAIEEANERDGVQKVTIIEDTPHTLEIRVTSCAWCEFARLMGSKEYALPTCYSHIAYFQHLSEKLGFRFKQVGMLPKGANACHLRFSRHQNAGP